MKQISEEKDDVLCTVFAELKSLGVKVPKVKKFKSCVSKQARTVSIVSVPSNRVFGISICEQEKVLFEDILLPKFIVTATNYLQKFAQKEIGLFRKAGSVSRQKALRIKLERGESINDSEPNDVASLLKQWLRELPEPLIPVYLQDLFVRCQNLQPEDSRVSAMLLCCHLLPLDHFCTLKHLLDFLSHIATHCNKNKMGAHNLALIMAPNIFVMESESIDKSSSDLVQQHTSVIELLINNAHKVVAMPACSSSHVHVAEEEALKFADDLDISLDTVDFTPCKSKKKRRSGTVQGIFSNIRKLVGQNSLSPTPSKRPNEDDPVSETRCASKRKADSEQLPSMSPLKKQATASKVLHNDTPKNTPNSKTNRSIFSMREKTGSHSRRKSFGLLRRKEKKRRNSKSNLLTDTKPNINTPDSFQEDVKTSFKKNEVEPPFLVMSSPLLPPIHLENLFSENGFSKKSVSDCYLINKNKESKNSALDCRMLSTSSSEGCLLINNNCDVFYNLRSNDAVKRAVKRKSDDLNNNEMETSVSTDNGRKTEKENQSHSYLSSSIENEESSPAIKKRSPKQVSFRSQVANPPSLINCDQNQTALQNSHQSDHIRISNISIQQMNSQRENAESLNKMKLSSTDEKENCRSNASFTRGDVKDVNDTVPSVLITKPEENSSSEPKAERVKRNCSIHRQEAFIIKSKNSKKNTISHLKRADSIKISKSRSVRSNNQVKSSGAANKTNCKPNVISANDNNHKEEITHTNAESVSTSKINSLTNSKTDRQSDFNCLSKDCSNTKNSDNLSVIVSDKKRSKRNARNGSIVRGRPNTVSSGLPLGPSSRYCSELNSGNLKHQTVVSTSSVDNNVFISAVKKSEESDSDLSIILKMQNIALSPKDEKIAQKDETLNCSLQPETFFEPSEIKDLFDSGEKDNVTTNAKEKADHDSLEISITERSKESQKTASRKKSRGRLCSNSDSKINHRKKKKTSEVSRINSFPKTTMTLRPRNVQELRAVKSSSPRKSLPKNLPDETEKENLHIEESQNQLNVNDAKTPAGNSKSPIIWSSAKSFFEAETPAQDDIFCKRESIAMIVKNNRGHVRSKASIYEHGSVTSTPSDTPGLIKGVTPCDRYYTPSCNITQSNQSQRKTVSVRGNKSTRRKSPLPPPPKFFISDSPATPSFPLKELTNISNSEDKQCSPSPLKKLVNTPVKDNNSSKRNNKCTLKPKMKSYSGHTPYKFPVDRSKVCRSESSPMLRKDNAKPQRNFHESLAEKSLEKRCGSSPSLNKTLASQVFKTKSCLSIEKLKPDQLVDEWNCEM